MAERPRPDAAARFIRDNTAILSPPHVPELRLHLADESHSLWLKTEEELQEIGLPPPFWAFAWAGGQGLARYVLDHPETVKGRRALDFASGSGIVAIAAKMAGARSVLAADIDPFSADAVSLNAALNGVALDWTGDDLIGRDDGWEIVLAGDIFYQRDIVEKLLPWFATLAERGAEIIVGDPGRAYFPKVGLDLLAAYDVAVTRDLEDAEVKRTTVWRFAHG